MVLLGGLQAQRVIKGLVALISSDLLWTAAVALCPAQRLSVSTDAVEAAMAASPQGAVSFWEIPLAEIIASYVCFWQNQS